MIINLLRKVLFVVIAIMSTDNLDVIRLQALSTIEVNDNITAAGSSNNNILNKSMVSDDNPTKDTSQKLVNLHKAKEQGQNSELSAEEVSEKSQKDDVAFYQTDTFKYAVIGTAVTAAALTGVYMYDPTILPAAGAALCSHKDEVIDFSKKAVKWGGSLLKSGMTTSKSVAKGASSLLAKGLKASKGIAKSTGALLTTGVKASKSAAKSTGALLTKGFKASKNAIVGSLATVTQQSTQAANGITSRTRSFTDNIVQTTKQSLNNFEKNFKYEKHHLFNVFRGNSQYGNYFKDLGINVDDYCVRISKAKHETLYYCTKKWKSWIDDNPIPLNATAEQIQELRKRTFDFARKMAKEADLSWVDRIPYK